MEDKFDNSEEREIMITDTKIEGGEEMVKLWIFRIKIGMSSTEQVPTVYRIPVYVGAIQDGIIIIDDVPVNYQERVFEELAKQELV